MTKWAGICQQILCVPDKKASPVCGGQEKGCSVCSRSRKWGDPRSSILMSQQDYMPEPQSFQSSSPMHEWPSQDGQSLFGAQRDGHAYHWSPRSRMSDMPKSEHPSTFEDSLPAYSYPAQDQARVMHHPTSEQHTRWQQQIRTDDPGTARSNPTKDTYQSYSQYNAHQQVPQWAPLYEHSRSISKWIGILLLIFILLISMPIVCSIGTVFVSLFLLFSLLPVILFFAPIALLLLGPLFRASHPHTHHQRWRWRPHRSRYDRSW